MRAQLLIWLQYRLLSHVPQNPVYNVSLAKDIYLR